MRKAASFIFLFLFIAANHSFAQEKISGDFSKFKFKDLVQQLNGYRFFYKDSSIDSLTVNLRADSLSLQELLQQVFQKTSFHFLINDKSVYITRQPLLLTP